MKILLTAFEPFDGLGSNSSLETMKLIECENIIKLTLPVTYKGAREILISKIKEYKPDFIISLGQAGGDSKIRLEKFGLNYTRGRIPDNDGVLLKTGRVSEEGALAYTTSIDVETLTDLINDTIPSYLSLSAGGYICNTVYYTALECNNNNSLFIHLPYYTNQGDTLTPNMSLFDMKRAVEIAIEFITNRQKTLNNI